MIRPVLHDRGTASREDLLDHAAAQEHYIGWLLEGVATANTVLRGQAEEIEKLRRKLAQPPASSFSGLGEWELLFGSAFGSKK